MLRHYERECVFRQYAKAILVAAVAVVAKLEHALVETVGHQHVVRYPEWLKTNRAQEVTARQEC